MLMQNFDQRKFNEAPSVLFFSVDLGELHFAFQSFLQSSRLGKCLHLIYTQNVRHVKVPKGNMGSTPDHTHTRMETQRGAYVRRPPDLFSVYVAFFLSFFIYFFLFCQKRNNIVCLNISTDIEGMSGSFWMVSGAHVHV